MNSDRLKDQFRLEILRDSILPQDRDKLSDADLVLRFSDIPDNFTLQKSAVYNDESIPGRSEPWKTYNSSNPTLFDFTAQLVAQGTESSPTIANRALFAANNVGNQLANRFGFGPEAGVFSTFAPRVRRTIQNLSGLANDGSDITATVFEEVIKPAAVLESLVYTQYNNEGIAFPPPLVNVVYGSALTRRGVVKDVRLRFLPPWTVETALPMKIECSVVLEETNLTPRSHLDVRNFQISTSGAGNSASEVPFVQRSLNQARNRFGL